MTTSREKTQTFGLHGVARGRGVSRRISTQTFQRAEDNRNDADGEITRRTRLVRTCCREEIKAGGYRTTAIDNTVFTKCGHYVTVKRQKKDSQQ